MLQQFLIVIVLVGAAAVSLNVMGLVNGQVKTVATSIQPNDTTLATLQNSSNQMLTNSANMGQVVVIAFLGGLAIAAIIGFIATTGLLGGRGRGI